MTTYIFDLDLTLYQDNGIADKDCQRRVAKFFMEHLGMSAVEAQALREEILRQYKWEAEAVKPRFGISEKEFMDYICNVDMSHVAPNPALNELLRQVPGRKFIFSDSTEQHVRETLRQLGVDAQLFEKLFVAEHNDFRFKFQEGAFAEFCKRCSIEPQEAIIFEDSLRNIKEAKKIGMTTVLISPVAKDAPEADHHFATITEALEYFLKF